MINTKIPSSISRPQTINAYNIIKTQQRNCSWLNTSEPQFQFAINILQLNFPTMPAEVARSIIKNQATYTWNSSAQTLTVEALTTDDTTTPSSANKPFPTETNK